MTRLAGRGVRRVGVVIAMEEMCATAAREEKSPPSLKGHSSECNTGVLSWSGAWVVVLKVAHKEKRALSLARMMKWKVP